MCSPFYFLFKRMSNYYIWNVYGDFRFDIAKYFTICFVRENFIDIIDLFTKFF